ncbi:hypothetical protein PHISCL_07843, partial [Aspergillus sclerotialis]
SLKRANGLDIPDSFSLTVFEDRSLEGASMSTIRERFQLWAATASQEKGAKPGDLQRYQYCIMVNGAGLSSINPCDNCVALTGFTVNKRTTRNS